MIENILLIFVIWITAINLITFAAYGIDKSRAIKNEWRISEATLIGLAVVGGSIGAYAGMKVFHHKTRHAKFRIGVPLIFAVQVALVIAVAYFAA